MRKRTFWQDPNQPHRAVWLESLLSVWRNIVLLAIKNVPSEDYDQTANMRKLFWISEFWIFAGRTCSNVRFLTLPLIAWWKRNRIFLLFQADLHYHRMFNITRYDIMMNVREELMNIAEGNDQAYGL